MQCKGLSLIEQLDIFNMVWDLSCAKHGKFSLAVKQEFVKIILYFCITFVYWIESHDNINVLSDDLAVLDNPHIITVNIIPMIAVS